MAHCVPLKFAKCSTRCSFPRKTCKFRLSRNSTKIDVVARFRETIPTVKSIFSSEIEKNSGFLPKLRFCHFSENWNFLGSHSRGPPTTYHIGGTRSVLSWETIVHYPRYKLRGQIRLKDTTFFVGLGFAFCFLIVFLHCRFVSFILFVYVFRTNRTTTTGRS